MIQDKAVGNKIVFRGILSARLSLTIIIFAMPLTNREVHASAYG
jgi:hypothetical protein